MPETTAKEEYVEFVRRIRQGDEQAAEELVRRYEPEIRLEVRGWLRLRNPGLRRVFDSMDICQSVLASFFARAAVGDFDLDEPPQLIRLLVGMARKKVAEQARHHQRQRRDVRRVGEGNVEDAPVTASDQTPSRLASGRELLQKFRALLSDDERRIADLRAVGTDWAGVAAELGGTPDGRRKQLARAVSRVELDLGIDSVLD
jgi:DNA-directed RNA polymerase specialized sigma24 family protein